MIINLITPANQMAKMDQTSNSNVNYGINIVKPIIILCVICSISLSPFTFQLTTTTNSNSNEENFHQEDIFVYVALISLCSVIIYLTYCILKQRCPLLQVPDAQVKSILSVVFSSHTTRETEESPPSPNNKSTRSNASNRRRIDTKYFRPKFIINELITIWGTTYTVITWGSVWVIGGTIVAGERLAQKIKTKCASPRNYGASSSTSDRNASRGTGRYESFSSYDSDASYSSSSLNNETNHTKSYGRRVRSWARKSYANARKRLNSFMNSGVPPQLTDSSR